MLTIIVAMLGFIAVAGLGFVFSSGGGAGSRTMKRAQAISTGGRIDRASRAKAAINDPSQRRKQLLTTLKEQERRQRRANLSIAARLQQAGLSLKPTTFWMISGGLGFFALMVLLIVRMPWWACIGLAIGAGWLLPRVVVGFLAKKRIKQFTLHFSDAIDIIVRGIKSGLPVNDCLRIIARESPAPLGPEFHRLVESLAMGQTMDQGLEKMFERMPTPELSFFNIVLAIQQKTGGNLAEALGNLSAVLRSRKLMREKIKALSAEATASAMIIGALPPGVVLLITVSTPAYMAVLYNDPRGHLILLGGAIWMCLGIFVMRRMINFKF